MPKILNDAAVQKKIAQLLRSTENLKSELGFFGGIVEKLSPDFEFRKDMTLSGLNFKRTRSENGVTTISRGTIKKIGVELHIESAGGMFHEIVQLADPEFIEKIDNALYVMCGN